MLDVVQLKEIQILKRQLYELVVLQLDVAPFAASALCFTPGQESDDFLLHGLVDVLGRELNLLFDLVRLGSDFEHYASI